MDIRILLVVGEIVGMTYEVAELRALSADVATAGFHKITSNDLFS
jgi:hypothetical protein